MSTSIRVVKGYNSAVTLPGIDVKTASLEYDGDSCDLHVDGGVVIIRAEKIQDVPVRKSPGAVYECTLVVNGDARFPCYVIANPLRPRL